MNKMSKYTTRARHEQESNVSDTNMMQEDPLSLGVRDTDFLLRLIKRSSFEGGEIEQAYSVISKLETFIGGTLKIDLKANELNIIVQAMHAAQIKGSDAVMYGKLVERLEKGLEKEMTKANANV